MKPVVFENRHIPLHYQIADYLVGMLDRGELPYGDRLPPEEQLTQLFGVSRTTIRHAFEHLLARGLVTRKQGRGTYWTDEARRVKKEKMAGVNRQIFKITPRTTVQVLTRGIEPASDEVAAFLGIPAGGETMVFRRIRLSGSDPMSYTINYLLPAVGARIEKRHLREMTMMETLEKVVGVTLGTVEHEVEITRANAEIAERLKIAVLDPVLTIRTAVRERKGDPIEIVWTHFVENKYKFRVVLD